MPGLIGWGKTREILITGDTFDANEALAMQFVQKVVAADAPEVELLAVRPAWVRVQAPDGTVIFEKILDAGERYALPKLEEPPVLRVGESGALYFAVNGTTYGPAGARGVVTKDVTLSPEALTANYALADLSSDDDLARYVAVADAAALVGAEPVPAPEQ